MLAVLSAPLLQSNLSACEPQFFGVEAFCTISGGRAGISQRGKMKGEIAEVMNGLQIAGKN